MAKIFDFHSHILPGLDHGSLDLSQSVAQIAMMAACGTDVALASSHFYPDSISLADFIQKREASVQLLMQNLPEKAPKIVKAAEVYCCPGLENLSGLEALCAEGTRCMLLEMPLEKWTDAHFETVDALTGQGFTILLAHIDRYPEKDLEALMQLDVSAQINASAIVSFWRRRKLKKWFENDRVWAIGSDLHGAEKGGYDHFSQALRCLDPQKMQSVMERSEKLLENAIYLN